MYTRNIKEIKQNLRAKFRQIRERMQPARKDCWDAEILARFLSLREYAKTETVFTYVSKEIEVDTEGLIHAALLNHKKVAVPRCVPGTRAMEFYYIHSREDLEPGLLGFWSLSLPAVKKWKKERAAFAWFLDWPLMLRDIV